MGAGGAVAGGVAGEAALVVAALEAGGDEDVEALERGVRRGGAVLRDPSVELIFGCLRAGADVDGD